MGSVLVCPYFFSLQSQHERPAPRAPFSPSRAGKDCRGIEAGHLGPCRGRVAAVRTFSPGDGPINPLPRQRPPVASRSRGNRGRDCPAQAKRRLSERRTGRPRRSRTWRTGRGAIAASQLESDNSSSTSCNSRSPESANRNLYATSGPDTGPEESIRSIASSTGLKAIRCTSRSAVFTMTSRGLTFLAGGSGSDPISF